LHEGSWKEEERRRGRREKTTSGLSEREGTRFVKELGERS